MVLKYVNLLPQIIVIINVIFVKLTKMCDFKHLNSVSVTD